MEKIYIFSDQFQNLGFNLYYKSMNMSNALNTKLIRLFSHAHQNFGNPPLDNLNGVVSFLYDSYITIHVHRETEVVSVI